MLIGEYVQQFEPGINDANNTANSALVQSQEALDQAKNATTIANEAYAYAGDVDNKVIQTNVDLDNLKTATNPALIGITAPTNTSTVTLDLERIVGTDNVPLPVASTTQAGVLNANDYKQLQDYAGRIGALEGSLAIYPVTLPSDNPSSEQITNAYTSQYPDAPNPPLDNTTVSDVQRKITYRYTSIGNKWIQVSYEVTQQFTNSSPGTIKGSTSAGMISANADGTGSLNGYDALNSGVAGSLSGVTAEGTATAINLITTKNNGKQTVVTLPQASNTQGGTISAIDYQKLQTGGVPIFTNDVLGAIKGSTEDGKISANADGTGTVNGYSALKTTVNNQGTAISTLEPKVNSSITTVAIDSKRPELELQTTKNNGTTTSISIPTADNQHNGIMSAEMFNQLNKSIRYDDGIRVTKLSAVGDNIITFQNPDNIDDYVRITITLDNNKRLTAYTVVTGSATKHMFVLWNYMNDNNVPISRVKGVIGAGNIICIENVAIQSLSSIIKAQFNNNRIIELFLGWDDNPVVPGVQVYSNIIRR